MLNVLTIFIPNHHNHAISIKYIFKAITLIILIFISNQSYGQSEISFRQLSVKEGLSQNSVISIAQDSTGYLWMATQDGLNKYDGQSFKKYDFYLQISPMLTTVI